MRVSVEDEEMGLDASQHNEKYLQGTLLVKHDGVLSEEENEPASFIEAEEKSASLSDNKYLIL